MDPNVTLARLLSLCEQAEEHEIEPADVGLVEAQELNERIARMVEHVRDLDGWIRSGGFLPAAWVRK